MTSHQPKLMNGPDSGGLAHPKLQRSEGGPVFEFGPGWGTKTKKWFRKYILAADCSLCRNTRYILLAGVVILIFFGPYIQRLETQPEIKIPETMGVIVGAGDSRTALARRAVTDYLADSGDLNLSAGQKVFMETKLVQFVADEVLRSGQIIEFEIEVIHNLGHEAELLSPAALKKWEEYAKKVKF